MAGRINAVFSVIDQLVADQVAHGGTVEEIRSRLQTQVSGALAQIEGGIGAEEHAACMARANTLIDQYCGTVREYQRGTELANDAYLEGGTCAANVLGGRYG